MIVPALGGAFGTGLATHAYEFIAILLAHRAGRPVKMLYSREEEFACLSPRQSSRCTISQGCDGDGRLTFRKVDILMDNGAYASWGATYPTVMLLPATSLYRVPAVSFDARLVYTNNTYAQAMRGYGNPEMTWAIESNLDELAEAAGIDAFELRRINCNQPGETTPMGLHVTTCGLGACLDATARRLDWTAKRGRGRGKARGVGMASLMHVGGSGRIYRSDGGGVILRLDDFGNAYVSYGGVEMGQGLHAALSQVVADALGVLPAKVFINPTDTGTCPWDVGTNASRGAFIAGNAAIRAAAKARDRIFALTAELHPEIDAADLDLRDGVVFARAGGFRQDLDRLLRTIHFRGTQGQVITVEAFFEPGSELPDWERGQGNMSATYAYGTQGVEVEVDTETGDVRIVKMVAAHDVGTVLHPQALAGQIYGALAQGVGYALYEEVHLREGRILNPSFKDYKIPTAREMGFPIELEFVTTPDPAGPYGAKGVGEPGLVPTAPAIANAIYDAIGVRIRDLPITPEKVIAALALAGAREQEGRCR